MNQSHEGVAHGAGDHQPGADDRQHRPARHRRELDHRPVQRDGLAAVLQHHEPARRPRLRQRRRTAPKVAGVLGIDERAHPDAAELGLRPDHRGHPRRARSRACGSSPPTPRTRGSTRTTSTSCSAKLDFLVVQDMYHTTETAQRADLVLPAAGWGEKEGTFINSERRIGLIKKVARAPGQALSDFHIFKLDRRTTGAAARCSRAGRRPRRSSRSSSELSRGQPCDITRHRRLRACSTTRGGIQWPLPGRGADDRGAASAGSSPTAGSSTPTAGRGSSSRTRGRCPSRPTRDYPLHAADRPRQPSQWHTQTRTAQVGRAPQALSRATATSRSTRPTPRGSASRPDEWVVVESRRGQVRARGVRHARPCTPGQVFLPMHDAATNRLTFPAFDPYSRQPAYKACAVALERLDARSGKY